MSIPPYPLAWPDGMPRTPAGRRQSSKFKTTLPQAINNVATSLRLFGQDSGSPVTDVVATTNVGGITLGGAANVDPGVAVWFRWDGEMRCVAVDRYARPEHNLQAIHHILEARRTEVRHGGIVIARTAFRGFVALPAPPGAKAWNEVLGVAEHATREQIDAAYREQAKKAHPDAGGSTEAMAALNKARTDALRARGA